MALFDPETNWSFNPALNLREIANNTHEPLKQKRRSQLHSTNPPTPRPKHRQIVGRVDYFSFFFGRSWLVCPHLRFRQLVARGGRRACIHPSALHSQSNNSSWWSYVALAADHLLAVVLGSKDLERGLNDTTTETEDEMQCRLLLDVVVGESAAILKLLSGEDQSLLIGRDTLLVLCNPTC